jgi:hypothetical protein
MLEKAQDLKRKYDLKDNKGKKYVSSSSLLSVASICNYASCSRVSRKIVEGSSVSGQGGTLGTPKNSVQEAQEVRMLRKYGLE